VAVSRDNLNNQNFATSWINWKYQLLRDTLKEIDRLSKKSRRKKLEKAAK